MASIVEVDYEVGARENVLNMLLPHDYACSGFEHDGRRKHARWLERISWYEVVARGHSKTVDHLMGGIAAAKIEGCKPGCQWSAYFEPESRVAPTQREEVVGD